MVARRERENQELYNAWLEQQRRREMDPDDDGSDYIGDFKQDNVRRNFIRKVFCILTLQLLFTTAVIACFLFVLVLKMSNTTMSLLCYYHNEMFYFYYRDEAKKFMIVHWYLWIIAMYVKFSVCVNLRILIHE